MNGLDVHQQGIVAHACSWLVRGILPDVVVVAAQAYAQYLALQRYRPAGLVALDEGVLHIDSLAKYAAAFFSMSRSILTRTSPVPSRLISICSMPTAQPASLSWPWACALIQLCSVRSAIPKILATAAMPWPLRLSRTASSLNSIV